VRVPHPHIELDPDGSPVIAGTRIPVRRVYSWHRKGDTVETILRRYPQIGPSKTFSALAFAFDNLELITADLVREREAIAQEHAPTLMRAPTKGLSEPSPQVSLPFRRE
jgi:uncharacterized protein (DUF433 family)